MIKIRIINMSCGHCRLKINAELEQAGFMDSIFDMDNDTININSTLKDINKAYKAISNVGYEIDNDFSPIITENNIFKVYNLGEKAVIEKVISLLFELGITDFDFDLEAETLNVVCSSNLVVKIKILFNLNDIVIESI